jgi:hypothetical protein
VDIPERYRLTLTSDGAVVMQGEWSSPATAERKFTSWIGSYSGIAGARIVLTEQGGDGAERMLNEWPEDDA